MGITVTTEDVPATNVSIGTSRGQRGPKGETGTITTADLLAAGAIVDDDFSYNGIMKRTGAGAYTTVEGDTALADLGMTASGIAIAKADGYDAVRNLLDAVVYVADRAAMKALDVAEDARAYFDGSVWEWDSSDLSATIAFYSVTSTAVDSGTEQITKTAHGLQDRQAVFSTTSVNGLTAGTVCYVIRVDADTFKLASTHANAVAGTAINLTGTTNFTVKAHVDPIEAVYVIPTGKAYDGSEGAWVRTVWSDAYEINWGGASGASDILPIYDSMKYLARGGALVFGAENYAASGTLEYTPMVGSNQGIMHVGAGVESTTITASHSGYAIKYEGGEGFSRRIVGGGWTGVAFAKSGGGSCSGVRVANNYHTSFTHIDTSQCGAGCIGFHFYAPSSGDTSACYGVHVRNCNFQSGQIGISTKGAANSVTVSQCDIEHVQVDSNASCGIWIANAIGINIDACNLTNCGDGASGTYLQRGSIYVEVNGNICQKVFVSRCEMGNNATSGMSSAIIIDGVISFRSNFNRFVRNSGEYLDYCHTFGFDTTTAVINDCEVFAPELIADGGSVYVANFGGSNKTYNRDVAIHDWIETSGTAYVCNDVTAGYIEFSGNREIRSAQPRQQTTGSGTVAITTNESLWQRVVVNGTGGTVINISGKARAGEELTLECVNSSGATTSITPNTGFNQAKSCPTTSGGTFNAKFKYSTSAAAWLQITDWFEYP